MRSGRATALGLAAGLAATVGVALAAGLAAPAMGQSAREVLEQQLKEQQARNDDLKQRIEKLEAMLKTDVCADPQAAELLLKETETPQPVEDFR